MTEQYEQQPQRRNGPSVESIWRIRWVLVALTAILAIVLLATGAVVIGLLVAAITVTRVVMMVKWQRRRRELRDRNAWR